MKTFIAIADVHLKINKDAPVSWSVSRYKEFFKYVVGQCKSKNADLLILGDLVDSNKLNLVELELLLEFFNLIKTEKVHTKIISGNHEIVDNSKSIYDYLKLETYGDRPGFSYITYNLLDYHIYDEQFATLACSYHKLKDLDLESYNTENMLPTIFLGHIRGNVGKFVKEEFPLSQLSDKFNAVFLGDIHDELEVDGCVYCNTPINSQYERQPNCSYLEINVDGKKVNWKRIKTDFPSLIQVDTTAKEFSKLKFNEKHFYRVNVKGTREELKGIPKYLPNCLIEHEIEGVELAQLEDAPKVEEKVYSDLEEEVFDFASSVVPDEQLLVELTNEWRMV